MYKVLIYTGVGGSMMSHPFAVERVKYLQDWLTSPDYAQIRQGNYQRRSVDTIATEDSTSSNTADQLQRQIEDLQREINRWRDRDRSGD
jgi:hypothetical protein